MDVNNNPEKSSTMKVHKHILLSFLVQAISIFKCIENNEMINFKNEK